MEKRAKIKQFTSEIKALETVIDKKRAGFTGGNPIMVVRHRLHRLSFGRLIFFFQLPRNVSKKQLPDFKPMSLPKLAQGRPLSMNSEKQKRVLQWKLPSRRKRLLKLLL